MTTISVRMNLLALSGALVLIVACAHDTSKQPMSKADSAVAADTIILGAKIYTMNPSAPWAQAIATRDGKIIALGSDDDVIPYSGTNTQVLKLPGSMVLPGLHDSHVHPVWSAIQQSRCNLVDIASVDEILAEIERCAQAQTGDWIVGGGYNPSLFPNGAPHKDLLDKIVPDRAVYLDDTDGHGAWVNTAALVAAGISAETKVDEGSVIEIDAITGEPMGTLREGAINLVRKVAPKPTLAQEIEAMRSAQRQANAVGLTSIIMAQGTEQFMEPVLALAKENALTLNILASLHYGGELFEKPTPELVANRSHYQTGRLKSHSAKIFVDGVLEGGTAAMLEPYAGYGHSGSYLVPPEALKTMVQKLDEQNVQAHIHAIGDAAIRAALDAVEFAIEKNGRRDNRHHITHVQVVHPDDISRFAKLNVTANFQALWAYPDAYITDLNLPELGQGRVDQMYPIASIEKSGGRIVGSSDWSVSSLNPFWAIETAITREDATGKVKGTLRAGERVSLETMLAAYTINGAWLMKQEDKRGSLEIGKAADMTIIDRNLFDIPPHQISETKVLYTFLDGEIVYKANIE